MLSSRVARNLFSGFIWVVGSVSALRFWSSLFRYFYWRLLCYHGVGMLANLLTTFRQFVPSVEEQLLYHLALILPQE